MNLNDFGPSGAASCHTRMRGSGNLTVALALYRGLAAPHRASRATLPEGQCAAMKWVLITEIWHGIPVRLGIDLHAAHAIDAWLTISLERIVIDRCRIAFPINRVNPLYIKYLEQIYWVDELPKAILIDPDLL